MRVVALARRRSGGHLGLGGSGREGRAGSLARHLPCPSLRPRARLLLLGSLLAALSLYLVPAILVSSLARGYNRADRR